MRNLKLIALVSALLPLAACSGISFSEDAGGVAANGSGTSRTFDVADFTGVSLRGSDDVDIKLASTFSVRAEGPSEVLDRLKIERDGTTLKIGRKSDPSFNWGSYKGAKIYVTLPKLDAANVAGSGDMTVGAAEGDKFEASNAGSGSITIAALKVKSAEFNIAGSGEITASGAADKLSMSIAGSGDIKAGGVKASSADASIAGSGSISADVNGPATVSILGSGDVDMGSNATCTTSKLGSGDVSCGK
ncbi:head GIN domain-containing protein [Sphingomonas sp. 28-62-11]|uniref:head GIN domain-containing protein n=1 Tax=Sphingomonas sp. 28-62-11 TaxID=1970432 RepID=UPI000BC79CDA|nr:MAG: DUF2807 domain-containing protein [Sphingomonas sp. 28-62-11]